MVHEPKRVLVTVGTDVHPFDRLIDWVEDLQNADPSLDVTVQCGTSRLAKNAHNSEMLSASAFQDQLGVVDLLVAQGGPGGITEARAAGCFPLVVPRRHEFGEHVDDHQVLFTDMLAEQGLIGVARNSEEFVAMAKTMLISGSGRFTPDPQDRSEFATRFLAVVRRPVGRLTTRDRVRRVCQSIRRPAPR